MLMCLPVGFYKISYCHIKMALILIPPSLLPSFLPSSNGFCFCIITLYIVPNICADAVPPAPPASGERADGRGVEWQAWT